MADVVSQDTGELNAPVKGKNDEEQTEAIVVSIKPEEWPIGVYAPFPWSSEPFAELTEEEKSALMTLDDIATKTDVAARRMEVEQAWESLHFDRGYQYLLRGRQGGWILPGNNSGFGRQDQQYQSGTYVTNIYGPKGDIIVAALSREVPKQEFFPKCPDYAPDVLAAEEADKFKLIWARNNNLHELLVECARIFWNEDRCVLWTRYELDGQKYGFEEDQPIVPTVPQNEANPPDATPTGQGALDALLDGQESPESESQSALTVESILNTTSPADTEDAEAFQDAGQDKKPLGKEVTSAFGKLDAKVPISVDKQCQMGFVQLFIDVDVAIAKSTFPWIADKIHPGSDGNTESQLDRIARQNVRQAVLGAYVTGDSLARSCTIKYTWLRPSYFSDEKVPHEVKESLLKKFPSGCLLGKAGMEFAFARNESMDDHIVIGHPVAGKGQNRRSMGSALISIQKRINDWVDLMDDFFRRTVPKKWYNSEAFNLDAMKYTPNTPGTSGPFLPQPGLTTVDQYIIVEPSPQPQPQLGDFIKWFITNLSEEISGALPSLFGSGQPTGTVGEAAIQRDQALQRVGCPWNYLQDMFAESARQAVVCARDCRDGKQVSQNVPGIGAVSVNTAALVAGDVLCYSESDPGFPESWSQRESKMMMMIDASANNQLLQQWLFSPENLPALADAVRLKNFEVPGVQSAQKQKQEFELLLRSGANPNPQLMQVQQHLQEGQQMMQQAQQMGQEVDPQMPQMIQQLQQMQQQMPQEVSSVPVAQDESELHTIEAAICFQWLNSNEGQKFKFSPDQKQVAAYQNVYLHWKEHVEMAKKIAAENAPPGKPPSESLSVTVDKMPPNVAIQALNKMGINATPDDFSQHAENQLNEKIQAKAIPEVIAKKGEPPKPPQEGPPPKIQ